MSPDRPVDDLEEVRAAPPKRRRMTTAHMIFLDAVAVLQVLFFIGATAYMFSIADADHWWAPLPGVAILLLLLVFGLWLKPKTNYAREVEPTPAGTDKDDDLSNKLLAANYIV